jgi:hypothetical protein
MIMKLFGREPTLVLQALSAVLGIIVALGWRNLSAEQAGLVIAAVSAGIGAVNAVMVRPVAPTAFVGIVGAGAALLAAYGLDVSQPVVGSISAATIAVMALLARQQVTPTSDVGPARGDGGYTTVDTIGVVVVVLVVLIALKVFGII